MTFDLFADDPICQPAPAAPPPIAPAVESYMMQPTGRPNEWRYRDVLVVCDMKRAGLIDHWRAPEGLNGKLLQSDRRVALCKLIDAALLSGAHPATPTTSKES